MGQMLTEPNMVSSSTLVVSHGQSQQLIKTGHISSVQQSLDDFLCTDKYPSADDSYYLVSYSGGASKAAATALDFQKSRLIATDTDCKVFGITDQTECTAYQILSKTKIVNFDSSPVYNFYVTIPAWQSSYADI